LLYVWEALSLKLNWFVSFFSLLLPAAGAGVGAPSSAPSPSLPDYYYKRE